MRTKKFAVGREKTINKEKEKESERQGVRKNTTVTGGVWFCLPAGAGGKSKKSVPHKPRKMKKKMAQPSHKTNKMEKKAVVSSTTFEWGQASWRGRGEKLKKGETKEMAMAAGCRKTHR